MALSAANLLPRCGGCGNVYFGGQSLCQPRDLSQKTLFSSTASSFQQSLPSPFNTAATKPGLRKPSTVKAAGQGFPGKPNPKGKKGGSGRKQECKEDEAVTRAVQIVEADEKKQGGKYSAGVDPRQAVQGKVDFVQVEAWGADPRNDQSEIEKLKVKSFSPAFTPANETGDFYEQLARRLALLETSGELRIAEAKPIPEFTRWKFGIRRYLQYLIDLRCMHRVLETAIEAVAPVNPAVRHFDASLGLHRETALAEDVAVLIYTLKKKGERAGPRDGRLVPEPTTQTQAYAKYIHQLGSTATSLDADEADAAQKKLLAHIFALHVTHLTSGMRIGSKALELLPLMREAQAVHFYRDYPEQAANPLKRFVTAINEAGEALEGADAREEVMAELPKALQKTSLLLMELAVVEDSETF